MAVPALRVPLGLDTTTFEKSIADAKSLTSSVSDFIVKEFAKMQARSAIKLAINSDGFKAGVQDASKFVGDQFAKIKPQVQDFTQAAVKETTEAGLKVAGVFASPAIKGSFQAFTAVGIPAATGLAQALAPIALRAIAVYEAFHLVTEAVGAARDQITAMVAIADKASNLNLTPGFLQTFEGESRKLKVTTDELDTALTNAFNATKEKSPIDLAKWEVANERITDTELELRVYNAELEKSQGKTLQGLVLFRDAQTQDDKVKSILKSMVELDAVGQHLQSLELGDKFFGTQFTDRIRQGKTSADGILDTMDKLKASGDGIFPDYLVTRAKAVDDQLKLSQDRLSRALKPTWDDLAAVILDIKSTWASVVDLIAKAVEYSNKVKIPGLPAASDDLDAKKAALAEVQARLSNQSSGPLGVDVVTRSLNGGQLPDTVQKNLQDQVYRLQSEIAKLENNQFGPTAPTVPSRGAGAAPKPKKSDTGRDPFDTAVDTTEKRIATLKAEAATIDDTTAARDRAKTVAQLEEAAKRANTAAGKENTEVTAAQRIEINKEADAMAAAADALEKAKVASQIKLAAGTAFLSQEDVQIAQQLKGIYGADIPAALASSQAAAIRFNDASKEVANTISTNLTTSLADVIDGTKTAGQAFQDFSKLVIRSIEEAIIKIAIVGPLMRSLQGGFSALGIGKVPAAQTAGAGGLPAIYAAGGYTGDGGRNDAAGIVHRGEYVFDQDAVKRIGIGNLALLQRGYSKGGPVGMPSIPSIARGSFDAGGSVVSFGDMIINVPEGTDSTSAAQIASAVKSAVGPMVDERIRYHTRPRGMLS